MCSILFWKCRHQKWWSCQSKSRRSLMSVIFMVKFLSLYLLLYWQLFNMTTALNNASSCLSNFEYCLIWNKHCAYWARISLCKQFNFTFAEVNQSWHWAFFFFSQKILTWKSDLLCCLDLEGKTDNKIRAQEAVEELKTQRAEKQVYTSPRTQNNTSGDVYLRL